LITKEELIEYIENAPSTKVKQLALTLSAMVSPQMLQVLDRRFTKRIDFEPVSEPQVKRGRPPKSEEPVETDEPETEDIFNI
jgi:hypothetical protein